MFGNYGWHHKHSDPDNINLLIKLMDFLFHLQKVIYKYKSKLIIRLRDFTSKQRDNVTIFMFLMMLILYLLMLHLF